MDPSFGQDRRFFRPSLRLVAIACVVAVPIIVSLVVIAGQISDAPAAGARHSAESTSSMRLLLAVAVVVGAALLGGRVAAALRQPPVIGEICAGLMLGPSFLGRLKPEVMHWLFPDRVLPVLRGLALVGVVLFMFGVGREFAATRLRGTAARGVPIAVASLLVPFTAGALVAVGPAAGHFGTVRNPLAFTIFLGCALSVTALPVLARILADLRLTGTRVGQLSLFAAALGDGVAWLLLSVALAIAQTSGAGHGARLLLLAGLVAGVVLGPVRWALRRAVRRRPATDSGPWGAVIAIGVMVTAATTAAIGVHEVIGGFLAGLACPRGYRPIEATAERLAGVTSTVFLPIFFAGFGLSVDLGALPRSGAALGLGAVLLAAAVLSKVIGPGLVGRLTGLGWREAGALGALLNARGLTELVVLQIGYQAGIIGTQLLGLLVIVTLVTTAMSGPLLHLIGFWPAARLADAAPGDGVRPDGVRPDGGWPDGVRADGVPAGAPDGPRPILSSPAAQALLQPQVSWAVPPAASTLTDECIDHAQPERRLGSP